MFRFKYEYGSLDVKPYVEVSNSKEFIIPGERIEREVLSALKAKFGTQTLEGAFDTNGTVIIRFNALKEAA